MDIQVAIQSGKVSPQLAAFAISIKKLSYYDLRQLSRAIELETVNGADMEHALIYASDSLEG